MSVEEGLLPCPFCGRVPVRVSDTDVDPFPCGIRCDTDDCPASSGTWWETLEAASTAWNRRAPAAGACEKCDWLARSAVASPDGFAKHVQIGWTRLRGFSVAVSEFGLPRPAAYGEGPTLAAAVRAARGEKA